MNWLLVGVICVFVVHLLKYLCLLRSGKNNVYTKNEKDDLTEEEKKAFKAVVKILKEE